MKYCGITQRQVAKLLNVSSGSTISKQIVRSRNLIEQERNLRYKVEKCEQILREMRTTDQLQMTNSRADHKTNIYYLILELRLPPVSLGASAV